MSSVERIKSKISVNALYTNIMSVPSSAVFSEDGLEASWASNIEESPAGSVLLRDMGKTVYLPASTTPTSIGSQSTIMRKVQLVSGYHGTSGGDANGFYTGYIKLGGQTYGGGTGIPSVFVRTN
jgi:hypothetical protein